jgi:hypothetical protein
MTMLSILVYNDEGETWGASTPKGLNMKLRSERSEIIALGET